MTSSFVSAMFLPTWTVRGLHWEYQRRFNPLCPSDTIYGVIDPVGSGNGKAIDKLLVRPIDIYAGSILREIPQPSMTKFSLKITRIPLRSCRVQFNSSPVVSRIIRKHANANNGLMRGDRYTAFSDCSTSVLDFILIAPQCGSSLMQMQGNV